MGEAEEITEQIKPVGSEESTVLRTVKKGARHALFPMLVLVVFSLIVDETYPFSDFPMYSRFPAYTEYYYFADGEGEPLPTKDCFGVSASAMKKMYVNRVKKLASKKTKESGQRVGGSELSVEEQRAIGDEVLDYLLPRGEKKDWWKENRPDVIRLIRVDIRRTDKEGLVETPRVVVERQLKGGES